MWLFTKMIIWNPERWSKMHVQGHATTVLFWALKISWYKSLPRLKLKEWLQRNDAIWAFGFLLSVLCLRNQAGLLSYLHAPSDAGNTLGSKGTVDLSWSWSASGWVKWKNFVPLSWVSWFSCGLRIFSCGEESRIQRFAVLHEGPNQWAILETSVERQICQPAPPPSWPETEEDKPLDFWVPEMSFLIHETWTIPHKKWVFSI